MEFLLKFVDDGAVADSVECFLYVQESNGARLVSLESFLSMQLKKVQMFYCAAAMLEASLGWMEAAAVIDSISQPAQYQLFHAFADNAGEGDGAIATRVSDIAAALEDRCN